MKAVLPGPVALAFTIAGLLLCGACSSSSSPPPGSGDDAASDAGASSGSSSGGSTDSSAEATSGSSSSSGSGGSSGSSSGGADAGLQVGDPCTSDSQCPGVSLQVGSCMKSWPGGGACTVVGCTSDCPGNGTWCTAYQGQTYCAPSCEPGIIPCTRTGYACIGGGCVPSADGG